MFSSIPLHYAGDEAFTALLKEVRCPTPLHEIKPFILGCLAASEMPEVNTILTFLWHGEVHPFDDVAQLKRLVGQLFALWNELAAWPDSPGALFDPASTLDSLPDIARHAALRHTQVTRFLQGLEAGGTDPDRLPVKARSAVEMLYGALHFWSEFERLSREQPAASAGSITESAATLRNLDRIADEAIRLVVVEQRQSRLERTKTGPKGPRRNDPCPCGSGKKYKRCCGAH